jgi:acyl-[acyl-carrier-protein]-phospholipid O-acyltransferase / long-chain-fatty-acid--[acyl-carrier-protein] ligase
MRTNLIALLRSRKFWPIFMAQLLGSFNDNFYKSALAILVGYGVISVAPFNQGLMLNIVAGLFVLPFLFFSAIAGQLADKYEKSRFIKIVKFLEIIIALMAIIGFIYKSFGILLLTLLLLSVQFTFFGPVKYSILPTHLRENELIAGNAWLDASTFISVLIGTILGGVIAEYQHSLVITGWIMLAFAVGGWVTSLYIPKSPSKAPDLVINRNILVETFALLSYLRKDVRVLLAVLGISWLWMIGFAFLTQFPALANKVLHSKADIVNLFLAAFTIGIAVGSLLCNRLLKGKLNTTFIPLGILGMSIFLFDFILAVKSLHVVIPQQGHLLGIFGYLSYWQSWRSIVDLFLLAVCGGVYIVPLYVALQIYPDETHVSRVIAGNNIITSLFMVTGVTSISMLLLLHLSLIHVLVIMAIANTVVSIIICGIIPEAVIKHIVRWILRFLFKIRIDGLHNYRKAGKRILVIANHQSFIDPLIIGTCLPGKLIFAINTEYTKKFWMKLIMKVIRSFPVDPANPMSTKSMIDVLKQDKPLMIFPEGRITVTGSLMKIYEGPGLIADKSDAMIVPIRISGAQYTYFSRMKGRVKLRMFPKIKLTILPPQKFDIDKSITGRERRKIISEQLYQLMTHMMFASYGYHQTLFEKLLEASSVFRVRKKILFDIDLKPMDYNHLILSSFALGRVIKRKANVKTLGIMLPNSKASVVAFFACQAYGIIPALLNFTAGIASLRAMLAASNVKKIITSYRFIEMAKLQDVITELANDQIQIIYLEDLKKELNFIDRLVSGLFNMAPKFAYQKINMRTNPNNCAVVLYTSGSEGTPKGVVLSHSNLLANCAQISSIVDFGPQDTIFNAMPMFHSFGLTAGTILPLCFGIKTFLYPAPLHYRIIPQIVYDINATIIFGTDTFLANYGKYAHPYDFYSIRYVFAGAEKLMPETRHIWSEKFGIRILEGYGATETSPVISVNSPMHNKAGTVGRFIPGIEYKLKSVEGIDEGGKLLVKGPNVMLGYYKHDKPGKIQAPMNGWYDTGDIVSIDNDGFITIQGRVKRFAKIGGEMVSLTAIEYLIMENWPDEQHALVAIRDLKKGEQLVLFTQNSKITRDKLVRLFKKHGRSEIGIPKKIVVLDELPMLGVGKIDYKSLISN